MTTKHAGASPVERHVRPLLDRLRAGCTDWDGTEMVDETQPMDCLTVGDVRDAVTEIQRLRAELAEAVTALPQAVRNDRERCAKLVTGNYGWRADTREYCDDLGDMLREA